MGQTESREEAAHEAWKSESEHSKADRDNHADQCNPNNPKYDGHTTGYGGSKTKADLDNHANQLNPNNPAYWKSREK